MMWKQANCLIIVPPIYTGGSVGYFPPFPFHSMQCPSSTLAPPPSLSPPPLNVSLPCLVNVAVMLPCYKQDRTKIKEVNRQVKLQLYEWRQVMLYLPDTAEGY